MMASSFPLAVSADWIADGGLRMAFNDNLNFAFMAADKKSDFAFTTSASAGQYWQLSDSTSLSVASEFNGNVYTQYDGLNNYSLGAAMALKRKLGLGAYAPWLRLSASASHADYQSAIRSSWFYKGFLTVGKRFDEKWDLRLEYGYLRRLPDNTSPAFNYDNHFFSTAVFDQASHGITLSGVYSYDNTLAFTGSYTFRTGDVFSTASSLTNGIAVDADDAKAVVPDDVFGQNQVAYKLSAITQSFTLGLSRAIGTDTSINLDYGHSWANAANGQTYHVNTVELVFLHRF